MEELLKRRQKLEDELKILQQDIYQSEESYIQDTWHSGNAIKGYDGYLSNKSRERGKSSTTSSAPYKIKDKDRIFSDSSVFLKFDKNGRRQVDSSCLSYGRIEFVDESSLIWDPITINMNSSTSSSSSQANNVMNTSEEENGNSMNGNETLSDQQLMPPPPKQIRNQFSNK